MCSYLSLCASRNYRVCFVASLFLTQLALSAYALAPQTQESSQQQQPSSLTQQQATQQPSVQPSPNSPAPQQPEAKKKKVWTNDDVISLRRPADIYVAEKEAQEAAAAEAAAEAAKAKAACAEPAEKLPETVEETQTRIATAEHQIAEDQQALDRYNAEVPTEPQGRKELMQAEIQRITAALPKEQAELKVLQDHLEKLTKEQPKQSPTPATPGPPPNPMR